MPSSIISSCQIRSNESSNHLWPQIFRQASWLPTMMKRASGAWTNTAASQKSNESSMLL